jgi:hypothetical protein
MSVTNWECMEHTFPMGERKMHVHMWNHMFPFHANTRSLRSPHEGRWHSGVKTWKCVFLSGNLMFLIQPPPICHIGTTTSSTTWVSCHMLHTCHVPHRHRMAMSNVIITLAPYHCHVVNMPLLCWQRYRKYDKCSLNPCTLTSTPKSVHPFFAP